jgi:hypothetical protein
MKYEIQHYTLCQGWVNTWTITNEDGSSEPEYFETKEQAISALADFLDEENREYLNGNVESPYDIHEFRIEEVL